MKEKLLIIILFISLNFFGQQALTRDDIYFKNKLAYGVNNNKLFTGTTKFVKKNGQIIFEKDFDNGYLTKYTEYYNFKNKQVKHIEVFYTENSFYKLKEMKYSYSENKIWKSNYDAEGKKLFEEIYGNDKLVYSCEYLGGKKNGKQICLKDDEYCTQIYTMGKKIK